MTTAAERKYINIRKRLDQLGYRQTLTVESLPLVEKLFRKPAAEQVVLGEGREGKCQFRFCVGTL